MVDQLDIVRSAWELIKSCREEASLRAAQRADECLEESDVDGQLVWKRILAAIDELQNNTPKGPLN